jgi:thiol:disulfide interchange protein DsbA
MNPRRMNFAHRALLSLIVFVLAGCASSPPSSDQDVQEDGYTRLASSRSTDAAAGPQVQVFFFYSCPHCRDLYMNHLRQWAPSAKTTPRLSFVPVNWAPGLTPMARAFHTGELARITPAFHEAMFAAFHQQPNQERTKEFFASVAEDCCRMARTRFIELYDSAEVDRRLAASEALWRKVRIAGTPSAVVNGLYLVTPTSAGSQEDMIRIMNGLLESTSAAAK